MTGQEQPADTQLKALLADIKVRIESRFSGAAIELLGDSSRMQIVVVSAEFGEMSRVKQQQSVYACIDDLITGGQLHAVTIRCQVPETDNG